MFTRGYAVEYSHIEQRFLPILMLRTFNTVLHGVVIPTIKLIYLQLHNCVFAALMRHNENIFGDRGLLTVFCCDPQVETHWHMALSNIHKRTETQNPTTSDSWLWSIMTFCPSHLTFWPLLSAGIIVIFLLKTWHYTFLISGTHWNVFPIWNFI